MHVAFNPQNVSMEEKVGCTLGTGFMGTTKYELISFLEEHYNPARHDMTAVFEARRVDTHTNEETDCVVMICEQLNPGLLEHTTQTIEADEAHSTTRYWENRFIFDSCFNPSSNKSLIETMTETQDHTGVFPGGYLHIFSAARPLGTKPVSRIMSDLEEEDLFEIQRGLLLILASRKNVGGGFDGGSGSGSGSSSGLRDDVLWYDPVNKWIWIAGDTVEGWYAAQHHHRHHHHHHDHHDHDGDDDGDDDGNKPSPNPPHQHATPWNEFWSGFVTRWRHARAQKGRSANVPTSFELCFRNRGNNNSSSSSHDFSDSSVSAGEETEWTMVEDGSSS